MINSTETSYVRNALHCLLLAICLLPGLPLHAAITVTDDIGQIITLPEPATRIVSLAPHITELLFAAGAGAAVVGVSEYSDYPDAATRIARIGGGSGLDLEAIVALQPDLVIAWQSGNPTGQVQRLQELGLHVFHSEPRRLQDIPHALQRLAQLAGTESAAQPVITDYTQRLHALGTRYANRPPVSVFYQVWEQPLMTINGAHMVSDVLRLCGGVNIFADQPVLAPQVSIEAVLASNPQAIVIAADAADTSALTATWQHWPQLQAVRDAHLYTLQRDLLVRHTPRILDGAEQLCARLEQARTRHP
jgi:iron complex transport system substrate-binding protein